MDALFNLFKVKYSKLDELMGQHCTDITTDMKVNLFINIEPVLKKLVASNVNDYLKVRNDEKMYEMISNIINLAAHYRLFFTKNKVYSKVYLYLNHPFKTTYKNRSINENYREYYEHRYTKDPKTSVLANTLETVLPYTKIILEYVDGVHLVEADSIESSLVPYVLTRNQGPNEVNFVLSTDRYDYQYVNHGFRVIRPKKDESYMVTKQNLFHVLKMEEKALNDIELPAHFYPFVLSLLGDKYRNIDKIKRIGLVSLMKTIREAIDGDLIGESTSNINILSNILKAEHRALLLNNFYCTDILTQYQMLNVKDTYSITEQISNRFDNVSLRKINDEFFKLHPLMLLELTGADALIKKKKRNDIFLGGLNK